MLQQRHRQIKKSWLELEEEYEDDDYPEVSERRTTQTRFTTVHQGVPGNTPQRTVRPPWGPMRGRRSTDQDQEEEDHWPAFTTYLLPLLSRVRRQFIIAGIIIGAGIVALASAIFSHTQLASLSVNSGTSKFAVKVLQDHETRITVGNNTMNLLKENEIELETIQEEQFANVIKMRTTLVNNEVEKEIRRIINALEMLSLHRLSPALINTIQLEAIYEDAKRAGLAKGLTIASTVPEDIFRFETSHLIFENGTLRIFVHMPSYRTNGLMQLMEYLKIPLSLGGSSRFILPVPEAELLAISTTQNLYRPISKSELNACTRVAELHYCRQDNFLDKRFHESCLVALYLGDHVKIGQNCRVKIQPTQDYLVQLNATTFVLYQHERSYIDLECSGRKEAPYSFVGVRKVTIQPGCTVSTRSFVFESAQGVFGEPEWIEQKVFNASWAISADILTRLQFASDKFYQRLSDMGSEKGIRVRNLVQEFADEEKATLYNFGLGSALCLLFAAVVLLALLRYRHVRKRNAQRRLAAAGNVLYVPAQQQVLLNPQPAVRQRGMGQQAGEDDAAF